MCDKLQRARIYIKIIMKICGAERYLEKRKKWIADIANQLGDNYKERLTIYNYLINNF